MATRRRARSTPTRSNKFARKCHTGVLVFSYKWYVDRKNDLIYVLIHDPRNGKIHKVTNLDEYPWMPPYPYPGMVKNYVEKHLV